MNLRHPMGVLHSFPIKNIFYDTMYLRLYYFDVAIYAWSSFKSISSRFHWRFLKDFAILLYKTDNFEFFKTLVKTN